jgi:IS1 family transposase
VYNKIRGLGKKVVQFYSDANSCNDVACTRYMPKEKQNMTKAQTHLIESINSSIRDNLKRFNCKTKGYGKSIEMVQITMDLFINRDLMGNLNRLF